jgi:hypothetical protein
VAQPKEYIHDFKLQSINSHDNTAPCYTEYELNSINVSDIDKLLKPPKYFETNNTKYLKKYIFEQP